MENWKTRIGLSSWAWRVISELRDDDPKTSASSQGVVLLDLTHLQHHSYFLLRSYRFLLMFFKTTFPPLPRLRRCSRQQPHDVRLFKPILSLLRSPALFLNLLRWMMTRFASPWLKASSPRKNRMVHHASCKCSISLNMVLYPHTILL